MRVRVDLEEESPPPPLTVSKCLLSRVSEYLSRIAFFFSPGLASGRENRFFKYSYLQPSFLSPFPTSIC